jgi:1-acyl-sn-glycerol-3-phosphate acyltransferase
VTSGAAKGQFLSAVMVLLRSLFIWAVVLACVALWVPLIACVRVFDRQPARLRTGRWFRRLGIVVTKLNPLWTLRVDGVPAQGLHAPHVVVSNHQSLADIPLISHLPWEMKWVAKRSLFGLPFIGWMMRMAGDIPLERADARSGARSLLRAAHYLRKGCPVMFFPEGTRSANGGVGRFHDGAFRLALRERVNVLPIAIDGSHACLPKHSWRFGAARTIRVQVLPAVEVAKFRPDQTEALRDEVRRAIIREIARWRGTSESAVDATAESPRGEADGAEPATTAALRSTAPLRT